MDQIFIEQEVDGKLQLACVDRHRIFEAEDPGLLANVFESSLEHPTPEDRAQIFYGLGSTIGADDWFADLRHSHRSPRLNYWSIGKLNSSADFNLFQSLTLPLRADRELLYSTQHSITPDRTLTSTSSSLLAIFELSCQQSWKNGMLQRSIDALVEPEFRKRADVYAAIDMVYRYVIRTWALTAPANPDENPLLITMREIYQALTPEISTLPETIWPLVDTMLDLAPTISRSADQFTNLTHLLSRWNGSNLLLIDGMYQIQPSSEVESAFAYLGPFLPRPRHLLLLAEPLK